MQRIVVMTCLGLAVWFGSSCALAQIEAPSEEDLSGVQPAFQDLVRGRSTKINQGASARAEAARNNARPPAPVAAPKNPSTDPRDLRAQWGAGGFGAPPTAGGAPASAGNPAGGLVANLPGRIVTTLFDANRMCLYTPALNVSGGKFYQSEHELVILNANESRVRRIRLGADHAQHPAPSYNGDSVGHWEGNTLVVHTIALKGLIGKIGGNVEGGYHTLLLANPTLELTERYTRNADGSELRIDKIFNDPGTDKPPYSMSTTLRYSADNFSMETEAGCEDFGDAFGPQYAGEKAAP